MVKVYPYVRGYAPRHALGSLWQLMEEEGATHEVFANEGGGTPIQLEGDLVSFVAYFSQTEGEHARYTTVCEETESGEVMGLIWYDRIQPKWSGFANIWMRKKFRGKQACEASWASLDYAFTQFGWGKMWALTPWKHAAKHAMIMGFRPVATLQGFMLVDGEPRQGYLLEMNKEHFYTEDTHHGWRQSSKG